MGFWGNVNEQDLQEFRPGIRSKADLGENLVMAVMEFGPHQEGPGHAHPFEQCGMVPEEGMEMQEDTDEPAQEVDESEYDME